MKKTIVYLSLFFLCMAVHAEAFETWLQGDVGYFYPTSDKFRQIYQENALYGGEITVPLPKRWALWASADYYKTKGHSIGLNDPTNINLVPLGLGVKYILPLGSMTQFYVGAGACYLFLNVHNDSPFVKEHVHLNGWGWVAKTGLMMNLSDRWFLNLFADYMDKQFTTHPTSGQKVKVNVSNVSVGLGLGYKFGCQIRSCQTRK